MKPPTENIAVVRRLYEARGNPEIIRQVRAPDVRWEVVEGFPHRGVYLGLDGVFDFFTRLFAEFEDWHTEPSEFFETDNHVIGIGTYSARGQGDGQNVQSAVRARLDDAGRGHHTPSAVR